MSTKIIIKYQTNRAFKDKYSKKEVKLGDIIDVDIKRMKELNKHNAGRVVDIIVEEEPETPLVNPEENDGETKNINNGQPEKYTKEQLEEFSVNKLKELAEKMQIELTKARKDEIIEEILQAQN